MRILTNNKQGANWAHVVDCEYILCIIVYSIAKLHGLAEYLRYAEKMRGLTPHSHLP